MQNNLKAAILAALLFAPIVSFAQEVEVVVEEESNFSWNAGFVSDYVFRGISQTNGQMALQGGLDYAFGDSGVYIGTWASTINYGYVEAPDAEWDFYAGWAYDFNDSFNMDLSYAYYSYYYGDEGSSDYGEIIGKFSMTDIATLTVAYTNNYSNLDGAATYVNLGNSWDLGKGYSINAGFGRTFQSSSLENNDGLLDYNDWTIGFEKSIGMLTIGLSYFDTNLPSDYFEPYRDKASNSVVLSFKIEN